MNGNVNGKILEAFAYKTIQEFARIIKVLYKEGHSVDDFIEYAKKEKEEAAKDIFEISYKRENKKNVQQVKAVEKSKPQKNIFLKSGDIELMKGVLCEKCQGVVYIEGICPSNPLVRQGFVRRGICGVCGHEFGIR